MGSRYSQLSLTERHQIARWRDAKVPVLDMARRLSRHVSTVHRELRRNRTDAGAWLRGYFAIGAQQVCDLRRRRRTKLHAPGSIALRSYIVKQLGNGWSPEQIAGYLRRTRCINDYVCHETISLPAPGCWAQVNASKPRVKIKLQPRALAHPNSVHLGPNSGLGWNPEPEEILNQPPPLEQVFAEPF